MKRELLDENSHPRVRKNKFVKYYSAINRITQSTVSNEAKVALIHLHNDIMEILIKEG
jgi:DNA polymerase I-like protein with 3'-5' exonuclease and polymerase domains